MSVPNIRPCPSCGNIYCEVYAYENGWQHVECDECCYLGPGEGSKLRAVRSHNAASAIEARRAETLQDGSVHESTVPQGDAQQASPNPKDHSGNQGKKS